MTTLLEEARALLPELQELRRTLHQVPEIGLDLPETQKHVLAALEGLDLEITLGRDLHSVTAVLRGGRPGPSVLLRGDMDALPVLEATGLDYASTNGNMHACGHDLHTAGLVGAVKLLHARRAELAGDVIFMFQPGEEGHGGAGIMIEEGLLDAAGAPPIAAYAIHVAPGPRGVVGTRSGPVMAGANEIYITVNGKGGHGSAPFSAIDPVPALVEIAQALQVMVTRKLTVFDPVVLTITQLSAGEAVNVIPPSASLGATLRVMSPETLEIVRREATQLAAGIAAAHGCTADTRVEMRYPVTFNDGERTERALGIMRELLGEQRVLEMPTPVMGSEDFSLVLNEIPGTFIMLSATPEGVDLATADYNHSPGVLFDDAVLGDQAAVLAQLAITTLAEAAS